MIYSYDALLISKYIVTTEFHCFSIHLRPDAELRLGHLDFPDLDAPYALNQIFF